LIMREEVPGESPVFTRCDPAEFDKRYDELVAQGLATNTALIERMAIKTPKAVALSQITETGFRNITFEELVDWSKSFARAMLDGGFCPMKEEISGRRTRLLGGFMYNRPEYPMVDLGGMFAGAVTVALYEEPREHLVYMVNNMEFDTIILQPNYANMLAKMMKDKSIRIIKNFIMTEELDEETKTLVKDLGVNIFSLQAIVDKGRSLKTELPVIRPDDLFMLPVTSGSTGYPKGVMITHRSLVYMHLGTHPLHLSSNSVMVMNNCYAFVSSKGFSMLFMSHGGKVVFFPHDKPLFYYSQPEKGSEMIRKADPTTIIFTPLYLHAVHDYVLDLIRKMPEKEGTELKDAIEQKIKLMKEKHELRFPELDKYIIPLREKLFGPGLKEAFYVGAKVREDTLWFFRAIVGCTFQSTYGQTELACLCAADSPFGGFGRIGFPQAGTMVKIVDCPDYGYSVKDVIDGKLAPRGELYIKSKTTFVGYFNDPGKSQEAFASDGWVKTRDVVQLNLEDMSMKIVGRANEVSKITSVDFIPVEALERAYETSPYVSQIYVHAVYDKDYLVGVIVPKKDAALQWAKAKGLGDNFEELCKNAELIKTILDDLHGIADAKKLNSYDHIMKAHLHTESFSTDSTMVTYSGKLRRAGITAKFQSQIEALYKS